ncbi:MAG: hypothetical protein K0R38_7507, partial [Polyangiaceae bacterium]|nr:hypothetical protein [Polyangiaceae bacterium]
TQGGAGGAAVPSCEGAMPCGGNVVGTWKVAASCLKMSGEMDTSLLSLGCPTVPVNGSLQATGTFIANADGTYTDDTTTTGTVTTSLVAACLSVSSVAVTCERVGSIFTASGWATAACTPNAGSGCDCTLSVNQKGGLGAVVPFREPSGSYTTSGSTLTVSNINYQYCGSGNALTLAPQSSALSGSIVLTHDGLGAGGNASGGQGGAMGGGAGSPSGGAGGAGGGAGSAAGGAGGAAGSGGAGGSGGMPPVGMGPCDIYGAANNTCVAAHSTIRALFGAYTGPLYQVKRASDGMTKDIPVKSTGGFADSAQQESFCQGTTCTIWRVYDQSGRGNFLEAETPDSSVKGAQGQTAANAAAEALTVGGNKVYSLFTRPRQAYWRDGSKTGVPVGAEPEGLYMVTSGTHFNGGCCYNYGNGQLSRKYEGGPTMDAIYFGNNTIWGTGAGSGPWVMADMEDGMLSGKDSGHNPNLPSMPYKYVTAIVKNNGTTDYSLRGADATTGTLNTFYQGALPPGKRPMRKQGAIVLGSGGDCCLTNNNLSEGTFYEGAIVTGYPANSTEDAVQQNIQSAGYGK